MELLYTIKRSTGQKIAIKVLFENFSMIKNLVILHDFCIRKNYNRKIIRKVRPNCALDRRSILYLYDPGFQKLLFKHVPKCK